MKYGYLILSFFIFQTLIQKTTPLNLGYDIFHDNYIATSSIVQREWEEGNEQMQIDEFESISNFWIETEEYETLTIPTTKVLQGEEIIKPILQGEALWDLSNDLSDYNKEWIDLQVIYNCKKSGGSVVQVFFSVIDIRTEQSTDIKFSWEKICGEGARIGFIVGTNLGDNDVIEDGTTKPEWFGEQMVSASISFTRFYIMIDQGFGSQSMSSPQITSSNPTVGVVPRGLGTVSNIIKDSEEDSYQEITIVYECYGPGSSLITVWLDVSPFQPIVWMWTKSCGGESVPDLNIGISPDGAEVVERGSIKASFTQWKSSFNERKTVFYLKLQPNSVSIVSEEGELNSQSFVGNEPSQIIIETVLVSSSIGGAIRPMVDVNGLGNQQYFVVDDQKNTEITLFYGCLKKSELSITLSILIKNQKMVEFTWKKDCVRLKPVVDNSVWTANQVLFLLIFLIALSIILFKLYQKRSKKIIDFI